MIIAQAAQGIPWGAIGAIGGPIVGVAGAVFGLVKAVHASGHNEGYEARRVEGHGAALRDLGEWRKVVDQRGTQTSTALEGIKTGLDDIKGNLAEFKSDTKQELAGIRAVCEGRRRSGDCPEGKPSNNATDKRAGAQE